VEATRTSAADTAEGEGPGDGNVYGAFVSRQLEDQRALKESLDRRALAVITSSGVLVTLLFGLAAITTRASGFHLPQSAHGPLIAALVAFVVACALAVVVSIPFRYLGASPQDLERIRLNRWREREWVARRRVTGTEIVVIRSYRRANRAKARLLVGASVAQLGALVALAVTVAKILAHQ
jgi:hypothetical protein